jgi:hypothetical protein
MMEKEVVMECKTVHRHNLEEILNKEVTKRVQSKDPTTKVFRM